MMQQSLRAAPSMKKRAKSVYNQRNLGTIKERKKEKKQEAESASEQIIMRILRMRCVRFFFFAPYFCVELSTDGADAPPGPGRRSSSRSSCRSWPRCRRNTSSMRARWRSASSSASRTATPSRPFPRSPRIDPASSAPPPCCRFPLPRYAPPPHIGYQFNALSPPSCFAPRSATIPIFFRPANHLYVVYKGYRTGHQLTFVQALLIV